MAKVLVSIGSNIDRDHFIHSGIQSLHQFFDSVELSPVYESEAVGFDGENFYNLVAAFDTDKSVGELSQILKQIEDQNGRVRQGPKFSARTLDIDILTYDQAEGVVDGVKLPRDEILENAFVLLPLKDLVPTDIHPTTGKTYTELWQAYPQAKQKLWQVELQTA